MRSLLRTAISFMALQRAAFGFSTVPSSSSWRPSQSSMTSPLKVTTQLLVYRNSYRRDDRVDKDINNIFEQNQIWVDHVKSQDPHFFDKLGSGHNPKYLWIGCADARVPANEIMGEDPGSVFVVRNVANLVVNTDFNLMSALQYAVAVLKVDHIILCGHYECGGIRASMKTKDHVPPLENWLRNIRDVYRLHREELDSIPDPEYRHRRLVELNVIEQCINLFKTGVVQRRRVETFKEGRPYTVPRIHACVFDPKTGDLNRLEVNFREYIRDLHGIYDLYTLDDEDVVRNTPHAPSEVDYPFHIAPPSNRYNGNHNPSPLSLPAWGDQDTSRRQQWEWENQDPNRRPHWNKDSSWSRQEWVNQDSSSYRQQSDPSRQEWNNRDSASRRQPWDQDNSRRQQQDWDLRNDDSSLQRDQNAPPREGDRYLSQSHRLDRDSPRSSTAWNASRREWDEDSSRRQQPPQWDQDDNKPPQDRMYPPSANRIDDGYKDRYGDDANRRDGFTKDGNFRADSGRSGFDWHGR